MTQEAPARTKVPTKSPQPARGAAAQSSAGRPKAGLMARGRVLASGTGRAATRGGGPVIELECGITVYPARGRDGRVGDHRGHVGHSGSGRNTCTNTRTARIAAITRRQ